MKRCKVKSDNFAQPWFPQYDAAYWAEDQEIVNLYEWEGTAGKPATKVARIDYDYLHEFDVRQADSAIEYFKGAWCALPHHSNLHS